MVVYLRNIWVACEITGVLFSREKLKLKSQLLLISLRHWIDLMILLSYGQQQLYYDNWSSCAAVLILFFDKHYLSTDGSLQLSLWMFKGMLWESRRPNRIQLQSCTEPLYPHIHEAEAGKEAARWQQTNLHWTTIIGEEQSHYISCRKRLSLVPPELRALQAGRQQLEEWNGWHLLLFFS